MSTYTLTDLAPATNAISRTVMHPEDSVRLTRSLRVDSRHRPRASSADTRPKADSSKSSKSRILEDDSPPRQNGAKVSQSSKPFQQTLSREETTDLFQSKIEDARQDTENALAGNGEVSEAVRPKLTLDLGHSGIARLPENVVDIIKAEVERLSLSHNQIWHIPLRFCECSQLRYLNIRNNVFREIPRGVSCTSSDYSPG